MLLYCIFCQYALKLYVSDYFAYGQLTLKGERKDVTDLPIF